MKYVKIICEIIVPNENISKTSSIKLILKLNFIDINWKIY